MQRPLNEIKCSFPSCSCNESLARTVVAAFAAQFDPTIEEISDLKTAVSEAVTNCIVHAYKESLGDVFITAKAYPDKKIVIKIRDRGCGIEDVEQAMQPMYTTAGDERSGLGFSVMESFMDKLHVYSKPGKGTTVTFEKYISSRQKENG